MSQTITIDPITRIEGHLGIKVDVAGGAVTQAWSSGESFRGFEQILVGRDPLDAQHITQRICGVCPVEHGVAANLAQEDAYGTPLPSNGRLLRNLIAAANFIQSHILHFYTLSAVDFIDVTAVLGYTGKDATLNFLKGWVQTELGRSDYFPAAPLLPRYAAEYIADAELNLGALKNYVTAFEMRTEASKLGALFGGKLPHAANLFPGGVAQPVKSEMIAEAVKIIARLRHFIDEHYVPDVIAAAGAMPGYFSLGRGPGNFLSFGVFHENNAKTNALFPSGALVGGALSDVDPSLIREDVDASYFSSDSGRHPASGTTVPQEHKSGAYSWMKAPRYGGAVMEVGPLARMLVAYHRNDARVKPAVDSLLATVGRPAGDLDSVMGRHAARALECSLLAERVEEWVDALVVGGRTQNTITRLNSVSGVGLTEAARGALGHWLGINSLGKVSHYQCVVPTTWNCSPRDDAGNPGALEQALVGVPVADADNPIEPVRVVRSFDPCLSCAVH
jgi:Ni,Fe-hydrogenase I large subunit